MKGQQIRNSARYTAMKTHFYAMSKQSQEHLLIHWTVKMSQQLLTKSSNLAKLKIIKKGSQIPKSSGSWIVAMAIFQYIYELCSSSAEQPIVCKFTNLYRIGSHAGCDRCYTNTGQCYTHGHHLHTQPTTNKGQLKSCILLAWPSTNHIGTKGYTQVQFKQYTVLLVSVGLLHSNYKVMLDITLSLQQEKKWSNIISTGECFPFYADNFPVMMGIVSSQKNIHTMWILNFKFCSATLRKWHRLLLCLQKHAWAENNQKW